MKTKTIGRASFSGIPRTIPSYRGNIGAVTTDTIVGAVDRAQPSKWLCKLTRVLSNEITFGRDEGRGNGRRWGRERKGTWNESKKRIESKRHKRIKGVPRKLRSINKCVSFSPLPPFFFFFLFSPIRHAIFMLVQNKILITNGRSSVAIRSRPVHAPFDSFAFPSRIFFSHNFFAVWKRNSSYNLVSTSRSQGSVRSFSLPLFRKWTLTRKKLFLFLYRFRYLPRCLRVFYFLLHFFFLMNFYTRNYNWFHWRYTREEYLGKKRKKKKK